MGILIRDVDDPVIYDQGVQQQVEEIKAKSKIRCMDDLLHSGETWEVE